MSSRSGLTQSMFNNLTNTVVSPILLLEGVFESGTVRLWTGLGTISWNGSNWLGGGLLLGVGAVDEGLELRASGTSVTLSGIPSEMISIALQDCRHGASGKIWLGLLDNTGSIVADPYCVFQGRLDVPTISDDGSTATIQITYENLLEDLFRPLTLRYTDAQQKQRFAGDKGLSYAAAMAEMTLKWGG